MCDFLGFFSRSVDVAVLLGAGPRLFRDDKVVSSIEQPAYEPSKMRPPRLLQTSVKNFEVTQLHIPEER